jgi:hypothetical protein
MKSRPAVLLLAIVLFPIGAFAQTSAQSSQSSSSSGQPQTATPGGPMTVEAIHDGPLAAPDVKITQFDGQTDALLGGYAGWLTDNTFFIGGGGYWLVNPSHDHELGYGGVIVQWLQRANAPFGFAVKGLIGGGWATLPETFVARDRRGRPTTVTGLISEGFFVAEPQIDALIRVTRHTRLTVGAGYRFTAGSHNDSDISGPVATIGFQFGGGS